MNRTVLLITAASMLVAGCKGPRGRAGTEGPEGPAGPITDPPSIASISPSSGSANTIWTITGANLGTAATVTFNGFDASVLSASDTQLVVTDAFPPVGETTVFAVSVENADQVSNAHAVFGFPAGTPREGDEWRIWSNVDDFAVSGTTWYVSDATRGIYAYDTTTRDISRVLPLDAPGMGTLSAIDVVGTDVYVTATTPIGVTRLFRKTAESWELYANVDVPLAVLDAGANQRYVVDAGSVTRLNQDGTVDSVFSFSNQDTIGGAAIQGGTLYVSYPNLNKIVSVDNVGAQTDFATAGLSNPRNLVGDGATGLYVVDDLGVQAVDNTGAVTLYSNQSFPGNYGDVNGLARLAGGELLLSNAGATWLFRMDDATTGGVPASGLKSSYAHARVGSESVYAELESCFSANPAELTEGVILSLTPTGARIVSAAYCSMYGLSASGTDAVLAVAFSSDATKSVVARIDLQTGTVTVLADQTDGLSLPVAAVENAAGEVFILNTDNANGNQSSIYKVAANGTVTPDFIAHATQTPGDFSIGLALSGDYVWATRFQDANGLIGGIYRASTATGGDWEPVYGTDMLQILPYIDALIEDGNGGVYVADYITGAIWHIAADGTAALVAPLETGVPLGLDVDWTNGDFLVAVAGSEFAYHRVMP